MTASDAPRGAASALVSAAMTLLRWAVTLFACYQAFTIRTIAINEYGRLIHECVPARA